MGTGWKDNVLRNDHDAILDDPVLVGHIRAAVEGADDHIFTQAGILVDDGAFDVTAGTDPDGRLARFRADSCGVIICTHQDTILDLRAGGDNAAHADDRVGDFGFLDLATFSQQDILRSDCPPRWNRAGSASGYRSGRAVS